MSSSPDHAAGEESSALLRAFEELRSGRISRAEFFDRADALPADEAMPAGEIGQIAATLESLSDDPLSGALARSLFERARPLLRAGLAAEALDLLRVAGPPLAEYGSALIAARCRLLEGRALRQIGRPEEAQPILNDAIDQLRSTRAEVRYHELSALFEQARVARAMGLTEEVTRILGVALPAWFDLFEEDADPEMMLGLSPKLRQFASAWRDVKHAENALDVYERGLTILRRLGPSKDLVDALLDHARLLYELTRYEEAGAVYGEAALHPVDRGFDWAPPEARYWLAVCLRRLGRHEQALLASEQSLAGFEGLGPTAADDVLECLLEQGRILNTLERHERLLAVCDRLASVLDGRERAQDYRVTLVTKAHALRGLERREEALEAYERAITECYGGNDRERDDDELIDECRLAVIEVLFALGRWGEVVRACVVACEGMERSRDRSRRVRPMLLKAHAFKEQSQFSEAADAYESSVSACGEAEGHPLLIECQMGLTSALFELKRWEDLLKVTDEVLPQFADTDQDPQAVKTKIYHACALWALERIPEATMAHYEAITAIGRLNDRDDRVACHLELSHALFAVRRWEEVVRLGTKLSCRWEELGLLDPCIEVTILLAKAFDRSGRPEEALCTFNVAMALCRQHGATRDEARVDLLRSHLLRRMSRHEEAIREYDHAILKYHGLNEPMRTADCLEGRGDALAALGRWGASVVSYETALSIYRHHYCPRPLARCLASWAGAQDELGDYFKAVAGSMIAVEIDLRLDDQARSEATAERMVLAIIHLRAAVDAEPDRLIESARQTIRDYRVDNEFTRNADLTDVDVILNKVLHALRLSISLYFPSMIYYDDAHDESASLRLRDESFAEFLGDETFLLSGNSALNAHMNAVAGSSVLALSNYEAMVKYMSAEHAFDHSSFDLESRRIDLLAELGHFEEAISDLHSLLEKTSAMVVLPTTIILLFKAEVYEKCGLLDEAFEYYEDCLIQTGGDRFVELPEGKGSVDVAQLSMFRLGCLENRRENWNEALGWFIRFLRSMDELLDPGLTSLISFRGAEALAGLERWQASSDRLDAVDPELLPPQDHLSYAFVSGLVWLKCGLPNARERISIALGSLRSLRRKSGIDDSSLRWVAEKRRNLDRVVAAYLEAGFIEDAFEAAQDGKASLLGDLSDRPEGPRPWDFAEVWARRRELVDAVRNSPEDFHSPAIYRNESLTGFMKSWRVASTSGLLAIPDLGPPNAETIPLEAIRDALPEAGAILDFWVDSNDQIYVFIVTRDSLELETVRFPTRKLAARAEAFRMAASRRTPRPSDELLDDLHGYLFSALRPRLLDRGISTLHLVPHGPLQSLPLHASRGRDGDSPRYLCDEFQISYLPSSSIITQLSPVDCSGPVFSLSNPGRGTPRTLPFAEWESGQLRHLSAGLFEVGDKATLARTLEIPEAGIIHFSCHGHGNAFFAPISRLELADDSLLAFDVMYQLPRLKDGSLVILNGCQTSLPDSRAIDEAMGLMTSFLLRGSSVVLATQWRVHDACAAVMVSAFVRELDRGRSPFQALQAARRDVRDMTLEGLIRLCEEVLSLFAASEQPHEVATTLDLMAQSSYLAGMTERGRRHAQEAAQLYRDLGQFELAARLSELVRRPPPSLSPSFRPFDHPVFWAAFQLIGRT